jgi:hypothetical protein
MTLTAHKAWIFFKTAVRTADLANSHYICTICDKGTMKTIKGSFILLYTVNWGVNIPLTEATQRVTCTVYRGHTTCHLYRIQRPHNVPLVPYTGATQRVTCTVYRGHTTCHLYRIQGPHNVPLVPYTGATQRAICTVYRGHTTCHLYRIQGPHNVSLVPYTGATQRVTFTVYITIPHFHKFARHINMSDIKTAFLVKRQESADTSPHNPQSTVHTIHNPHNPHNMQLLLRKCL